MINSDLYRTVVDVLTKIAVKNQSPSYEQKLLKLSQNEVVKLLYVDLQDSEEYVSEFLKSYFSDGKIYRLKPKNRFYLALRCDTALLWLYTLKDHRCPFSLKQGTSLHEMLQWLLVDAWDLRIYSTAASLYASALFGD